jgi:diacylglycerol kinase (ATP)
MNRELRILIPSLLSSPNLEVAMARPGNTGIRRIVNATSFSLSGLRAALRTEAAFRQECALAVVLIPLAFWLGRDGVERSLLIASCVLVLIVELMNTAVECVVDRIGTEHHELSGRAKDVGSAAVLLSLILTAIIWALIAWSRFGAT